MAGKIPADLFQEMQKNIQELSQTSGDLEITEE
jgi:hypothetical protein